MCESHHSIYEYDYLYQFYLGERVDSVAQG